jgi:hypothetical protein
VKNRKTQSALLVAGAAAGAVAATLISKRRLRAVPAPHTIHSSELVEPESAELPLGVSADPDIDDTLSRSHLPQDSTSGGALLGEVEERAELDASDASLDDVWNAMPGLVGGEQTEGYDAVQPEDLGAVWLERATQTTHDERPHASDPNEVPNLDALAMSEGSVLSARAPDEIAEEEEEIGDDDLGPDVDGRNRSDGRG